ncbi:MAG: glycoside hydrolase family 92 protein [Flaviflexus sp.]|uniref:glycoside hydrolase domain-containing protein n=1 Tax=Flaviflexus sp. TaxID=1969482 RepID=UPI00352F2FC6
MKTPVPDHKKRSSKKRTQLVAGVLAAALPATLATAMPLSAAADEVAPFDLVNQFIGTELDTSQNKSNDAYGNAFPGAAVPFGMVQSSPATYKVGESNDLVREKGGYEYTANQLRGFGLTRYEGSGCHVRFGGYEVPTIPYTGDLPSGALPVMPSSDIGHYYLDFDHENETSQPGYYSVTTDNGVSTELTATERTAVSRFNFEEADGSTLIVNVSGQNNRSQGQHVTIDPEANTVSGWMRGADICDNGNYYTFYFSTTYDQEFESYGVWNNGEMMAGEESATLDSEGTGADFRNRTGAWLTFADDATVTARTGISYVSVANAELNREAEADDLSFDEVRANARASWEEALGTIEVTGGTENDRVKFYSALYRSFLHPNLRNDVNGQYLGYDNEVHEVEEGRNFYKNFAGSGWDMYRSQAQLIALTYPEVAADINQSIVALTEQTGSWAPGAARMQGDSLQTIIATTDDMGITNYDREAALQSMIDTQQLPGDKSTRTDAYQYFATA